MPPTYSKDNTGSNITVGNKFVKGKFGDTYTLTRGFLKFDLSSWGLILSEIASVNLKINVGTVVGSQTYNLRSATTSNNWGTTLDATQTDFESTNTNLEYSQIISTTGIKTFTVNKNNLDLSGFNYFRLAGTNENTTITTNITFNSQNSSTNKPYLEFVMLDGGKFKIFPHAGI